MKSNKRKSTSDKITNMMIATLAGAGTKFALKQVHNLASKQTSVNIPAWAIDIAPEAASFFLLDSKDTTMHAAAYGICGAVGVELGHDFGIYDALNGDDLNGIFSPTPKDVKIIKNN